MSIAQDEQQVVSRYLADGFKVVRLRRDTKRPLDTEWPTRTISEEALHEWVRSGGALGLQMGQASGWVACVDLDWPEARRLAPVFLPETLMAQKGEEEPSQFFFRAPGLPFAKFNGLGQERSSEILSVKASDNGKGHQVAVEPTVHERKGPYRWVGGYDASRIAEVPRAKLEHRVRLLAASSLIARVLPPAREEGGGGRHDFALALSGYLLRGGLHAEEVTRMLVAAWECRKAPREALEDVQAAVRDTEETIIEGGRVTGGPTVGDVVPGLAEKLAKFLGFSLGPGPVGGGAAMYLNPPIETEDVTLQEAGDKALAALLEHNNPPKIFTRSGTPIRLMHDPREDEPLIQELTVDLMRFELAQAADFIQTKKSTSKYVFPPRDVVTYVRSHTGTANLPAFVGVTRCPVVRPDGTILLEEGYDPLTGLWFAPQEGLKIPRVSETPSPVEVEDALRIAWEPLQDFPFADKASAANIFAFPLTILMRPAIEGHVPLLVIDKPEVGTGASLMVDALALSTLGKSAGAVGAPGDDDAEMRKLITGALRHSRQIVFFDNVATELKHASLARALTIDFWEDRLLGHSVVVRLPQRSAWVCTGNNIPLSKEIARRSYKVRLDAKQERPWEGREFIIPDLPKWSKANRGRVLWAYLTLARNWYAQGRSDSDTPAIGMFEEWTEVISGVLAAAGVNNFLANREELYEKAADAGGDWYAFLSEWTRIYGDTPQPTKAIARDLYNTNDTDFDNLRSSLPDDFGTVDPNRVDTELSRRLGNAFKAREGRRYGPQGLHLVRAGTTQGATRWQVTTPDTQGGDADQVELESLLDV